MATSQCFLLGFFVGSGITTAFVMGCKRLIEWLEESETTEAMLRDRLRESEDKREAANHEISRLQSKLAARTRDIERLNVWIGLYPQQSIEEER